MKISNYLSSLLPSFGRDQVLEDIGITRNELKDGTLPSYDAAVELLKGWHYKSKKLAPMFAQFERINKSAKGASVVEKIHAGLGQALKNLDTVETLISKTYNEEVAAGGLTYLKAQLLQFVEAVGFVSKFARKYLQYVYIAETAEFPESGTSVKDLAPAEVEWLETNWLNFCQAFACVATPEGKLKAALDQIPDVVANVHNESTLEATMGAHRIDPLQMRLIPLWLNPIYHVGMAVAEWQAKRFKAAQEEVRLLQLRRLNLQRLSQGKPDAKLQKEVQYLEGRIQSLNFDLEKMERKYA